MKLKDYFSKVKKQAKLGGEEFDKFIEAIPDGDIPDLVNALLEESFLTRERAAADPELVRKMKAEVYNGVDSSIHDLLSTLPTGDQEVIKGELNSHKKIKLLQEAFKKQYEELKKNAPDSVKVNEEHLNTIKELTARLETEKKEKETVLSTQEKAVKEVTEKAAKELKAYRIKNDITGKLAQIEFAKEFTENPKVKDTVFNGILNNIVQNELDYDESGHIIVQEVVNGVAKPKFFAGTNDQVTLDKLLEAETTPYIKRNNADPVIEKTTPRQEHTRTGGKTLREMRAESAMS